jgi:hypothetical protein
LREAWSDETLTVALPGIDYSWAFPSPDPDLSLVATMNDNLVGQCTAQPVRRYWKHAEGVDGRGSNASTQAVPKIHTRACGGNAISLII